MVAVNMTKDEEQNHQRNTLDTGKNKALWPDIWNEEAVDDNAEQRDAHHRQECEAQ